jgi:hypothetical protein
VRTPRPFCFIYFGNITQVDYDPNNSSFVTAVVAFDSTVAARFYRHEHHLP